MNRYGLLGEKLSHSFSPQIHGLLGDYDYNLFEIRPDDVANFLLSRSFDGLNVTIPYKKTVIPYCTALSASAKKIGSVNTILRRPDGSLYGDNTDYDGFSYLLDKLKVDVTGKKVIVLGSGGSSLTVQTVLTDRNAATFVVISRSGNDNYKNIALHHDAQIVVNTTPVGMYPNNGTAAVDLTGFQSCEAVLDIVYNPFKTALLLDAEESGVSCINGLPMLVAQAKRAAELFTGSVIDNSVIDDITDRIARQTKNIVLIGMPGSGKSTTGAALAGVTGRVFYDTDTLIEKRTGKSIPDIFAENGEAFFRQLETDILSEVSKKSGVIIATGGGIVKRPENYRLIRQNSFCVFLERDITALPTDGRPLSQTSGLEALAKERLPLYNSWCDFKLSANGIDASVQAIRDALCL